MRVVLGALLCSCLAFGGSDAGFVRRAYFDIWGLPPSPAQLAAYEGNRAALVRSLLADRANYAENWVTFWNDLLRNDEGVVYHGTRESITKWLLGALQSNMPYDQMVRALLEPVQQGDPKGYLIGVNWRGDVSASQVPAMQAAQNSAQVFLGINLKCNSCHDSFINKWKLKDAYGLASYFSPEPMEIYRCDVRTGEKATRRFPLDSRGESIAQLFTGTDRFARTMVNRYYQRLLGKGLISDVDNLDLRPRDAELLDTLSKDFVSHGYDLQYLIERIMLLDDYHPRRLSAEQFADAISAITGEWRVLATPRRGPGVYSREWRLKSSPLTRALGRPIRDQVFTTRSAEATTFQALEVVNGETMTALLDRASRRLPGKLPASARNVFDSGVFGKERFEIDLDVTGVKQLRLLFEDGGSYDPKRTIPQLLDVTVDGRLLPNASPALGSELKYDVAGHTRFQATLAVNSKCFSSEINPRVRVFAFTTEPDLHNLTGVKGDTPTPRPSGFDLDQLYLHALSRKPTADERRIAESMDLADLLWAIFLSPEFQFLL